MTTQWHHPDGERTPWPGPGGPGAGHGEDGYLPGPGFAGGPAADGPGGAWPDHDAGPWWPAGRGR